MKKRFTQEVVWRDRNTNELIDANLLDTDINNPFVALIVSWLFCVLFIILVFPIAFVYYIFCAKRVKYLVEEEEKKKWIKKGIY